MVDYQIREAFKTYFKTHKILAGRHSHMLLELFKYITENPEPSEQLLEKLKQTKPAKQQFLQGLVFSL